MAEEKEKGFYWDDVLGEDPLFEEKIYTRMIKPLDCETFNGKGDIILKMADTYLKKIGVKKGSAFFFTNEVLSQGPLSYDNMTPDTVNKMLEIYRRNFEKIDQNINKLQNIPDLERRNYHLKDLLSSILDQDRYKLSPNDYLNLLKAFTRGELCLGLEYMLGPDFQNARNLFE